MEENNNGNENKGVQEVVHQQNNENITIHAYGSLEFGEEIRKLILTAGTLDLPDDKNAILFAPVKDDEVYIKPDGLIYMTWTKFAARLSKAVGLSWTMIPEGMPKISKDAQNNNLVIWGFHLMIKGVYCGFAIGEQQYHDNKRMTYGEACEGAKSNALTRLCKALGIAKELWDKEFINNWLAKYADKKWLEDKRKYHYFLKPNAFANLKDTQQVTPPVASTPVATAPVQTQAANTAPVVTTPVATTPVATTPVTEEKKTEPAKTEKTTPVTITTTVKPAKEGVKTETPAVTPKVTTTKAKPGYTGKAGKSKIAENTDFLSQKKEKVPLVPLLDGTEGSGEPPVKPTFESLEADLDNATTKGKLQMVYNGKVKEALIAGHITEEQKETLRKKANALFVKLSAQGK